MSKLVVLNGDGSFQEIQTISVSSGPTSAGQIAQLNGIGQFDSSMIPATGGGPSKSFIIAMAIALG
jgi:hypothetical protein